MKALTIHPLFVELITNGLKTIECRTWSTDYRGDILITSSAKKLHDTIPGHALAVAELCDIRHIRRDDSIAACMRPQDCNPAHFAWILRNIRLIEPFPVKGKLSLWNFTEDERIKVIMSVDELLKMQNENPDEYDAICDRYWESLYV